MLWMIKYKFKYYLEKAIELTKGLKTSDEMTQELLKYALKNGSKDNISILILVF